MKQYTYRILTTVFVVAMASELRAGGVAGGGGPPALEDLQDMLQGGPHSARVFEWNQDQLGLGVDAPLSRELVVTREQPQIEAINMSSEDFDLVADRPQLIQAINLDGQMRTYRLEKSLTPDVMLLVAPL